MASGKQTYLANKLLDLPLGATAFSAAGTLFIGLFTVTPGFGSTGTEVPFTNGYTRFSVTNSGANFLAASGGAKTNNSAWTFPAATGTGWGTITGIAIFDASSAGNMYYFADLQAAKVIGLNDVFSIPTGNASFTES